MMVRAFPIAGLAVAWAAGGVRADMVTEWNAIGIDMVAAHGQTSTWASRSLAMMHAAVYDAVNAVERTHAVYRVAAEPGPEASPDAAAAAAAHAVLSALFPDRAASLDFTLERLLGGLPDGPGRESGVALGASVGGAIVSWRAGDHANDMVPYVPGTGPGDWRPTPPGFLPAMTPQWAVVTPFAMADPAQFRTAAPPSLPSAAYAAALNEVQSIGSMQSATRTPEETAIAWFWMDMPGTITTVGRWNKVAAFVGEQRGLTLAENARLFALLNIALADAGITAWSHKYEYGLWRPITAIREADTDGNPDTVRDATWQPLIMTPPFPEYVSAHSTFSAAAAAVLERVFGTEDVYFAIADFMMPVTYRAYTSFSAAAEEAGASRIYGGIHFPFGNLDGLEAGRAVGEYVAGGIARGPLLILPAPPVCGAGTVFSLDFELLAPIIDPVDIYLLADTPYGIFTISPGGRFAAGITPIFRGVSGVGAPLAGTVMGPVVIPGGIAAGMYTFHVLTVDAGAAPPAPPLAELGPRSPGVVWFDRQAVEVR